MKNSYLIAGLVILIAIVGLIFANRKTEAPITLEETEKGEQAVVSSLIDGNYKLDTVSSKISWEGEFLTGISEKGTIMLKSGEFKVENGLITGGTFIIDMNTIDSIPHKDLLVTHLKSDDFFSVASYPNSTFTLKKMLPSSEAGAKDGRYVIAGDLMIKGIVKPISFTTTMKTEGGKLSSNASFAINRADWEVKYNSPTFFRDLGDKIIRDAVTVGLDLQGQKVIE